MTRPTLAPQAAPASVRPPPADVLPSPALQRCLDEFARLHRLSPRQRQVLGLALRQVPTRDVCERLGIKMGTLRTLRSQVLTKASRRTIAEVVLEIRERAAAQAS